MITNTELKRPFENGTATIADVGSEGYIVTLSGCATTWVRP